MNTTLPIDIASQQLQQALADYTRSHDAAMACEQVGRALAVTTALTAMRYIEANGLTPVGRKKLQTAIESLRIALGLEVQE